MIIYVLILLIYASFFLELAVWPVKSEASAGQLLLNWRQYSLKSNLVFISVFFINSVFCLVPLVTSCYLLLTGNRHGVSTVHITGIILAGSGRIISISGARILNTSQKGSLITASMYKWSRNPISLGLFITFLGLVLAVNSVYLLAGWLLFIIGIDHKIGVEEEYLMKKYGKQYKQYKSRTPKYWLV